MNTYQDIIRELVERNSNKLPEDMVKAQAYDSFIFWLDRGSTDYE